MKWCMTREPMTKAEALVEADRIKASYHQYHNPIVKSTVMVAREYGTDHYVVQWMRGST